MLRFSSLRKRRSGTRKVAEKFVDQLKNVECLEEPMKMQSVLVSRILVSVNGSVSLGSTMYQSFLFQVNEEAERKQRQKMYRPIKGQRIFRRSHRKKSETLTVKRLNGKFL